MENVVMIVSAMVSVCVIIVSVILKLQLDEVKSRLDFCYSTCNQLPNEVRKLGNKVISLDIKRTKRVRAEIEESIAPIVKEIEELLDSDVDIKWSREVYNPQFNGGYGYEWVDLNFPEIEFSKGDGVYVDEFRYVTKSMKDLENLRNKLVTEKHKKECKPKRSKKK